MRKHLQAKAALFVFVAVVGLGWSILAAPVALTVTPYADLVRFATQGDVKELHVRILSLAGQQIFDSGPVNNAALDWKMANVTGRTVATGVYLYAITVKDSSGNIKQQFGKLALVRGQGTIAPPIITTPTVGNQVQPKFTQCTNPCAEVHQGDITIQDSGGTPWAFFDSTNQRLGVGTTSPTNKLTVTGNIFTVGGTGGGLGFALLNLQAQNNSSEGLLVRKRGNAADINGAVVAGSELGYNSFWGWDGSGYGRGAYFISRTAEDWTTTGHGASFGIATTPIGSTGNLERLSITPAGNVGISTTGPSAQLHINNTSNQPGLRIDSNNGTNAIEVYNTGAGAATGLIYKVERATGNVYADGSFNCGLTSGSCFNAGTGADVAERIDAVEAMEAGDVVEIHPDQAGKFRKSQSAISRRVAGIISTAPAVTLGNNFDGSKEKWVGDNRPLLALAGRVPVKVLAKYGAIQVGDLLVSSPIPGYAMKCPEASQCIGAVIGKALEPLAEGVGKIEVQVMLR
ncbi:hypothetical protein HY230_04105 [Candidatus Acetothermia bacterium]|nr:hypothetical protein [Candidatus Acetothermia bacterium]